MNTAANASMLAGFGDTPEEAASRLKRELDAFEEAALGHLEGWLTPPVAGRWSTAQLTEHVLLANESFGKVVHLLRSDRPLPDTPRTPGRLVNGRAVAPAFLEPGPGQPWRELEGRWQEVNTRFLRAARQASDPARTFWHPHFGELSALGWTCAAAWHTRHHRRQFA